MHDAIHPSRRSFLRFLAGSPLLPLFGVSACRDSGYTADSAGASAGPGSAGVPPGVTLQELAETIRSPGDAINVFDFQKVAQQVLPPAHYGYLATGVDGDETLRANREGFERFDLRARRLVDVSNLDMSVELLGETWETPIVLAPVGSQKAFHPEGEMAAGRASDAAGHHQILSTVATTSVEEINRDRRRPVWFQLYPTSTWSVTETLIRRAEEAGCQALALTVDLPVGSNRETVERYGRLDTRDCEQCHEAAQDDDDPMRFPTDWLRRRPMFEGIDMSRVDFNTPAWSWDFVQRLRDATDMKVLVKGIVRDDDAARCVEYGVDGIIVSNHGGRAEASGRSTIESLPEVVDGVAGRIPVMMDSGIRRGTDILKALALGADAICIGRPYVWGLSAFGEEGVAKVLEILRTELQIAMQLHGVPSLGELDRSFVTAG
jgi:isopentenyl diphosphate isomerase/L-lactate dehydrogenase-like FMN-dependent dehydrogenase